MKMANSDSHCSPTYKRASDTSKIYGEENSFYGNKETKRFGI
ncbi:hypothetical protein QFZ87_003134 [Bacillus sp. SLBN-46]|nr:hypothetical protein [Bacillus sp. SLBN-46]